MQRKLAAILAADVVGYSRLMRADEVGTLAAMKALWSEVVQPSVRAHRGRVFKLMGDGMLAEFASVVDAANAAEAIQMAANERASVQAEGKAIRLRIGINLGDVVVDGSDLYGDGVNIAARLQEVAEPGGIAISSGTHDYLRGKSTLAFADAGERTLKNIDEPVRVWLWPDTGEPPAPVQANPAPNRSTQPSIAVLPFQNLSTDPDAEFFADGMTEDVINALSKFRWLFVIARGTMFTYKTKPAEPAQVFKDLGVRYVLEGSVRQAGNRLRITGQLTDTGSGNTIWSDRFDRQLDDIFAIQDEITNAIAARIAPQIEQAESTRAEHAKPAELDVWLLYQKGLRLSTGRQSAAALNQGSEVFAQTLKLDPDYVPALAMLAQNQATLAQGYAPEEHDELMEQAKANIDAALALNNRDSLVLASATRVYCARGQFDQAERCALLALDANPNLAYAHYMLGMTYTQSGRAAQALEPLDLAAQLSPLDPNISRFFLMRAAADFWLEQYEDCIADAERSNTLGNNNWWPFALLPAAHLRLGQDREAREAVSDLLSRFPGLSIATVALSARHLDQFTGSTRFIEALRELGVPEE